MTDEEINYEKKYDLLCSAVRQLYFAAHWTADRPVLNGTQLWENLRDCAGIPSGHSAEILGLIKINYGR